MPIISSEKNADTLLLTLVAEFPVDVGRVWQLWADPRQLERWWGPPSWPAAFDRHDFVVGGSSRYRMTGPDGESAPGWWWFIAIDEPHRLEFDDGFADQSGEPDASMPVVRTVVTFEAVEGGARMTTASHFASLEQLDQLVAMGMEEGMREAMGQIDALLIAGVPSA
jgi:uncharacterized protein YndB with AHSA1/START domain